MPAKLRSFSRPIGAILMDSGLIAPAHADSIVQLQRSAGLRFGDAAVALGLVSENDLRFALAQQFDYAYLPLTGERPVSEDLLVAYRPFCPEAEQLRALRSQLLLRWLDKEAGRQCLAVVGSGRGEGRSFLAANLAVLFAQLGERTLLIDADLRQPRQHELFRLENKVGVSCLLAGRLAQAADAVAEVASIPGLAVLPAGPIPPNPLELLNRSAFARLLAAARGSHDIILIDTPAAEAGSDASMIAAQAGAALLVARRHQTPVAAFAELAAALLEAGVALVGSVLNSPAAAGEGRQAPWLEARH